MAIFAPLLFSYLRNNNLPLQMLPESVSGQKEFSWFLVEKMVQVTILKLQGCFYKILLVIICTTNYKVLK